LQRLVSAFSPEIQQSVCAQLADVLVGVVAQRLRFREGTNLVVPECEILMASTPVRALVRSGQFFKLGSALETGAADGSYTFPRYAEWLSRKSDWYHPPAVPEPVSELEHHPVPAPLPPLPAAHKPAAPKPGAKKPPPPPPHKPRGSPPEVAEDGSLVLSGDEEEDPLTVLAELEKLE
jgi:twitching motility protein PilT